MTPISTSCHVWACSDPAADLAEISASHDERQVFALADTTTASLCLPRLRLHIPPERVITIPAGDEHKDYHSLLHVWQTLSDAGATRHALLICVGGGMVCDLGGFAAATFKRGIECCNVPTTLLAQVDASLGGKTGMNLGDLKNEVGAFRQPDHVLIDTALLDTLDRDNMLSGAAEMIKHGCIADVTHLEEALAIDFEHPDLTALAPLVARSIAIKEAVVEADPHEQGPRKALNFGHTLGHAFETLCLRRGTPTLHGHAVAWGMVCELMLSEQLAGLPTPAAFYVAERIDSLYGRPPFTPDDADQLAELTRHDKKNADTSHINFTLLPRLGEALVDQTATTDLVSRLLRRYLAKHND